MIKNIREQNEMKTLLHMTFVFFKLIVYSLLHNPNTTNQDHVSLFAVPSIAS